MKFIEFILTSKFHQVVSLDKNLKTRKGSRRGNSAKMVQSASHEVISSKVTDSDWTQSKKSTFENIQKKDEGKKGLEKNKGHAYGAWGPVFKNKEHFSSLHHC